MLAQVREAASRSGILQEVFRRACSVRRRVRRGGRRAMKYVFIAWVGILDEEQAAMVYQFLTPDMVCEIPGARIAAKLTYSHDTPTEGMWACQLEPWADEPVCRAAIARNWAKFTQKLRDWNKGIRGEN